MIRTIRAVVVMAMVIAFGSPLNCAAQTQTGTGYPVRPIRLVAPIAPGGGVDSVARGLAQELSTRLAQPVIVDNRPGAGGSLGAELVAKAAPDGYTLLISGSAFVLYTLLYKARYDPVNDFAAVSQLVEHPYVMVLNSAVPAASVKEFIAYARSHPDAVSYASSGNGSLIHLSGELFKHLAKVNMTHVPYKGLAAAFPDIFAGRVHMTFSSIPTALPHIKSGRLRAIGVTSLARETTLPDVPTLEESGVAGFEATQWYGVFAPAATPKNIVARLQHEIADVLKTAAMAQRMAAEGSKALGNAPVVFSANIQKEAAKWRGVIAQANIKGD